MRVRVRVKGEGGDALLLLLLAATHLLLLPALLLVGLPLGLDRLG